MSSSGVGTAGAEEIRADPIRCPEKTDYVPAIVTIPNQQVQRRIPGYVIVTFEPDSYDEYPMRVWLIPEPNELHGVAIYPLPEKPAKIQFILGKCSDNDAGGAKQYELVTPSGKGYPAGNETESGSVWAGATIAESDWWTVMSAQDTARTVSTGFVILSN